MLRCTSCGCGAHRFKTQSQMVFFLVYFILSFLHPSLISALLKTSSGVWAQYALRQGLFRQSSNPSDIIQPLLNFILLASSSACFVWSFVWEGLAWAQWVLQFPSFGCVLHRLSCLCKICNDVTHHDSTEMSQDREWRWLTGHRASVMQGEEGYSK